MDNSLYTQVIVILHFFIAGIKISILFDIFRAQRKAIKTSDFITCIQDIIYWILVGVIMVYTVVKYTNGEIRAYMIIGTILGVIIYFSLMSKMIIRIIVKFFTSILFPIKKINKLIQKD